MSIELRCTFERTGPVDAAALEELARLFGDDCEMTDSADDGWTIEITSTADFDKESVEELVALVRRAATRLGLPLGRSWTSRAAGPKSWEHDGPVSVSHQPVIQSSHF